jgi:Rieske Fe-S protein
MNDHSLEGHSEHSMESTTDQTSRRSFLKLLQGILGATGLAAVLGPVLAFFWPKDLEMVPSDPVPVGALRDFVEGSASTIPFGRYPALVIHTASGIRAYSAVCTHFACICKWNPESEMIECPCHEGFFNAEDGSVISGPPPRPLDPIHHFVQDGVLYIGGEA